jgi:fructose-bisphosphate aldolase, class I
MVDKKKMENNLEKITKNGRALFLAYDHGLEHGTGDFDEGTIDPAKIMEMANREFFTGVILQKGLAEEYYVKGENRASLIVKLNGKTNLLEDEEPYSPQICTVEEAVKLGASACGYTIYVGSAHEAKMTSEFAKIEKECEDAGLPLIGWMYPRGKSVKGKEHDKDIVAYAARMGLEMGAEMIKIPYTGDVESFSWVVKAAGKAKVVVVGGAKKSEEEFLKMIDDALEAGACGVAVGRNVWQAENPLEISRKIAQRIFNN